ncbi:MAG: oxidoreductase, partial [Bacteroidota bacterium]
MKIIIVILVSLVGSLYTANTQVIYEAEDAVFSSGKIDNKHAGFTGDGFVDTENKVNEYIEWQIHSFKEITDSVGFRYAL